MDCIWYWRFNEPMLPQRTKQFKICIVTAALDSKDYALRVNTVYEPSLRAWEEKELHPVYIHQ
jgi:acid stress-induced BolA-like protein IbaG/YrbA